MQFESFQEWQVAVDQRMAAQARAQLGHPVPRRAEQAFGHEP